jgi:two-component system response regulator HydG
MALVYILDDDVVTADAVAAALRSEGHDLRTFTSPEKALEASREEAPAVAITDFAMPGMNGLEFVLALRTLVPDVTFLVVSGQATVQDAVALMKHGVVDVLVKPPRAPQLRRALALALAQHELAAENQRLRQALRGRRDLTRAIGSSPAFDGVLRTIERVAATASTVLLQGETGTGKEVVAEALHQLSPRADRPLVKVHCAAIPETLLESELFGHARGSFTGAIKDKPGLIEQAHGGTLLLDEIGEVPLEMQVKLLRVLETGEVQRIGELQGRRADVRVVAATNRDLEVEVAAGRFREDLFYRLNVILVRIPPLRQRGDDVVQLARHFLAAAGRPDLIGFTDEALAAIRAHRWPGNVRELENAVARAAALADGPLIETADLPEGVRGAEPEVPGLVLPNDCTLDEAERRLILNALDAAGGNKKEAARRLGIGLATLYRKLAHYDGGTPPADDAGDRA